MVNFLGGKQMKKSNKKRVMLTNDVDINSSTFDSLLRLLDTEIMSITSRNQKYGWSIWVLIASLATLIWILLSEIEGITNFDYLDEILTFFFTLGIYIYSLIRPSFSPSYLEGRRSGFVYSNNLINQRPALILMTLISLSIFVNILASDIYSQFAKISSLIFFGFILLFLIFLSVLNIISWPLPKNYEDNTFFIIIICFFALLSTISLISQLLSLKSSIVLIETIKIAGLVFSIIIIFLLLLSIPANPPFLHVLTGIRQDLLLGRIDIDLAKEKTEIALLGLDFPNILHKLINNYILIGEDIISLNKDFIDKLNILKTKKDNQKISTIKILFTQKEEFITIFEEYDREIKIKIKQLNKSLNKIQKRIRFMAKWFSRSLYFTDAEKFSALFSPMNKILNEVGEQNSVIKKYVTEFKSENEGF